MTEKKKRYRPDKDGSHRSEFELNRKKILMTAEVCAICGQPLYPEYKYPHPLSTTVDHIIPIAKGGHPSDMKNLQAAHFRCNRLKSDLLPGQVEKTTPIPLAQEEKISNRVLPQSTNWSKYRAG